MLGKTKKQEEIKGIILVNSLKHIFNAYYESGMKQGSGQKKRRRRRKNKIYDFLELNVQQKNKK